MTSLTEQQIKIARRAGADNEVDYYKLIGYWPGCPGWLGQRRPLVEHLRFALRDSRYDSVDFSTPRSLARKVGWDEHTVRTTLLAMDDVRRPPNLSWRYDDLFRLKDRGLTRREWWRLHLPFLAIRGED